MTTMEQIIDVISTFDEEEMQKLLAELMSRKKKSEPRITPEVAEVLGCLHDYIDLSEPHSEEGAWAEAAAEEEQRFWKEYQSENI